MHLLETSSGNRETIATMITIESAVATKIIEDRLGQTIDPEIGIRSIERVADIISAMRSELSDVITLDQLERSLAPISVSSVLRSVMAQSETQTLSLIHIESILRQTADDMRERLVQRRNQNTDSRTETISYTLTT